MAKQPILTDNRIVAVPVSLELFTELITKGNELNAKCVKGLPDGATFCGSRYDDDDDIVTLLYYHESFSINQSGTAPLIDIVFEVL